MQTIRFSAALAALALLAGFASTSYGQAPVGQAPVGGAPGQNTPKTTQPLSGGQGVNGVGVIDIKYIFANYPKFDQQMKAIRGKAEQAEADVRRDQESLRQMMEKLKGFQPNSPEFRQTEAECVRKKGDLDLKIATHRRQFMDEEGRLYFYTAREIEDAVRILATRFNLGIVFRVSVEEPNPNDRNDIMSTINKSIIYSHPQMDITPFVLTELQRNGGGNPANPNPLTTRPVPRPQ